jgi:hypothetical protein
MGVPASEVDYTSATTGRGDHEVHKGHVVALAPKKFVSFVWLSEKMFYSYIINRLVFVTEMESVYSAVRTDSLYKIYVLSLKM